MLGYFIVRGQSMEPLCKEGDFVLLDKLSYRLFRPKRGDVVVLRHPQGEKLLLKYIVGEQARSDRLFFWVEGVNKEGSSDSRTFGWIPRELILGKAIIVRRGEEKFSTERVLRALGR